MGRYNHAARPGDGGSKRKTGTATICLAAVPAASIEAKAAMWFSCLCGVLWWLQRWCGADVTEDGQPREEAVASVHLLSS
jgi:hypothetical protein